MGAETTCAVTYKGMTSSAKVRLETSDLQIRGTDLKLDVPFSEMKKVVARTGSLSFSYRSRPVTLAVGSAAAKWADKILHPPSRLTKIGVQRDWRVAVLGEVEQQFIGDLRGAAKDVLSGRAGKELDAVFVAVAKPADFKRLAAAKSAIKSDGAVWIIRPKGNTEVTERSVMAAGKAAGLVDVKVVGFSDTHSALKFVIPVKYRHRS